MTTAAHMAEGDGATSMWRQTLMQTGGASPNAPTCLVQYPEGRVHKGGAHNSSKLCNWSKHI